MIDFTQKQPTTAPKNKAFSFWLGGPAAGNEKSLFKLQVIAFLPAVNRCAEVPAILKNQYHWDSQFSRHRLQNLILSVESHPDIIVGDMNRESLSTKLPPLKMNVAIGQLRNGRDNHHGEALADMAM